MNKGLEDKLFRDFSNMFRGHNSGDPKQTLMVFGFSCANGWFDLIYKLCTEIKEILEANKQKDFVVLQVKEKFGGLRFYSGGVAVVVADQVFSLIYKAEEESYNICELCGEKGSLHERVWWYKTVCGKCAKEHDFVKVKKGNM